MQWLQLLSSELVTELQCGPSMGTEEGAMPPCMPAMSCHVTGSSIHADTDSCKSLSREYTTVLQWRPGHGFRTRIDVLWLSASRAGAGYTFPRRLCVGFTLLT